MSEKRKVSIFWNDAKTEAVAVYPNDDVLVIYKTDAERFWRGAYPVMQQLIDGEYDSIEVTMAEDLRLQEVKTEAERKGKIEWTS